MKIKEIKIENFRSIKSETIIFPESDFLGLVGANNAGKSNILLSINNILGESWFNGDRAEKNDFYNRDINKNLMIKITFDDGKYVQLVCSKGSNNWPEYFDSFGKKIYRSEGNVKIDYPCTFLPAIRSLEKNLQFRSYEIMGKIAKSFNKKAQDKKDLIENKFEEVMEILNSVQGFEDFKNDFSDYFEEMQADTPYQLKIDFKAFSPLNYFKTINIVANDSSVSDEFDIDVEELGEGNKSLLLFALLRSYAKNFKNEATGILAIEEPEIYLHPQARRHLFEVFIDIINNSNIQIIYTTHSPDFLKTEFFDSIGKVIKDSNEGTKVKIVSKNNLVEFSKNTGVPEDKTDTGNITEFYTTTSNYKLNEAFFSNNLFLVEGETEELCFPILFSRFGINTNAKGISFIAVNGKNQIPKYWRLFYSFGIKTNVIIDNDDDGTGNKRKSNRNIANCFNTDIQSIINFEEGEIIKILNCNKEDVFSQQLIILNKDFENTLKLDFQKYCIKKDCKLDFQEIESNIKDYVKPTGNSQKGQISRGIIRELLKSYPDYKPEFVKTIIDNFII